MAIAGATAKIRSEEAISELEKISGVSLKGKSPTGELILLIEAENLDALHKKCRQMEKTDGVLGIYPSYVTTADEE